MASTETRAGGLERMVRGSVVMHRRRCALRSSAIGRRERESRPRHMPASGAIVPVFRPSWPLSAAGSGTGCTTGCEPLDVVLMESAGVTVPDDQVLLEHGRYRTLQDSSSPTQTLASRFTTRPWAWESQLMFARGRPGLNQVILLRLSNPDRFGGARPWRRAAPDSHLGLGRRDGGLADLQELRGIDVYSCELNPSVSGRATKQ